MSEDLALYRGESGKAYLLANLCAHRLTKLHTGWIEDEQLRCMDHGWKYDASGQCVERPAERPGSHGRIRVTSYPVHEYCGLIFTWMGEGEPPVFDLPRKPKFEGPDVLLFQHAENSLDAVHVNFAHQMGKVGVFGHAITDGIPALTRPRPTPNCKPISIAATITTQRTITTSCFRVSIRKTRWCA